MPKLASIAFLIVVVSAHALTKTAEDPSIVELPFQADEAQEAGASAPIPPAPIPAPDTGSKPVEQPGCVSQPEKPNEGAPPSKDCLPRESVADSEMSIKKMILNLPGDQKAIWTSPLHLRKRDFSYVIPLLGTAGGLIRSDHHSMSRAQAKAIDISRSNTISNVGLGMVAVPVFMYAWGRRKGA